MISSQRTYSTSQIIEIPSVQSSDNASLLMLPLMQFSPSNIRIAPFLTPEYTDDEFWYIMKEVMGVLYLLGFPYPISCLISFFVFKKEQKIKEGLYMMGQKDGIFTLSWFSTYALQDEIWKTLGVCPQNDILLQS